MGPQGCRAGVPYAGVRHYGDGVHSPRVASAVVQSGGTWYTIMLVLNDTNTCFRCADWRDQHYVWRRRGEPVTTQDVLAELDWLVWGWFRGSWCRGTHGDWGQMVRTWLGATWRDWDLAWIWQTGWRQAGGDTRGPGWPERTDADGSSNWNTHCKYGIALIKYVLH